VQKPEVGKFPQKNKKLKKAILGFSNTSPVMNPPNQEKTELSEE